MSLTFENYTKDQEIQLVKFCNEWIYNVNIRKEIDQLESVGVSYEVIQSLKKFWKLRGKTRSRDQMKGIGVTEEDEKEGEILHGTVRGVYKAEGEEYAQSIQTNPHSKYEMELDVLHPTIKLDYIFKDKKDYDDDIKLLEKSFENNVPIGIVMVLAPNKWKILGLCKITEHPSKREFILKSYGISDEESTQLKDETFKEYDRYNVSSDLKKIESIDWKSFAPQIDPLEPRFQKITENPPTLHREPAHIDDIIKKIEEGEWAIPDFQRYYQWKQGDVRDFLQSIFDDHYIGALLLWDIEDTDKEQCGMIRVEGSNPIKLKGDKMVLDGQQRITSLHYAINAPDKTDDIKDSHPGFFYINFGSYFQDNEDDDDEEKTVIALNRKITDEESFERLLFPFYKLKTIQKDEWLSKLKKFVKEYQTVDLDKLDDIVEIIRKKTSRIYHTYDIPQIVLSQTTFDNVGTIFMNINTKGKSLDVFDLISVKMSAFDVSIRDLWKNTLQQYPKIKEYDKIMKTKMGRYIMEVISLSFSTLKSCKRNDILEMFGKEKKSKGWTTEQFKQMWAESAKYLDSAINRLEDKSQGFGVIIPDVLPYEPMLPILASLLREIETNFRDNSVNCYNKLERWYWTSVFGERFSQSVEAKKSSDYKDMVEWFSDESKIPKYIKDFQNQFKNIQLEDTAKKDSVLYTGVLCLLAKKGAVDFEIRFSSKQSAPHMDHIFPKSQITHTDKNSILNITWLSQETNVGTKKAKMPSKYIPEVIEKKYKTEKEFRKVLSSHLINDKAYDCLLNDKFEDFIKYRKIEILKEIANQIDTVYVEEEIEDDTPNSIYDKSIEELIQMDEDDELEFKATLKYNRRAKMPDKIMLQEVVTTVAGFMNSRKGGLLLVGYDEDLDEVNGIEEDYQYTGNKKFDSWRGTLMSSFSEHCKKEFEVFIDNIVPINYEGKTVAKIIVKHSDKPVFYDEDFYRRSHGKTQKLVGSDMHNYINRMWSELK